MRIEKKNKRRIVGFGLVGLFFTLVAGLVVGQVNGTKVYELFSQGNQQPEPQIILDSSRKVTSNGDHDMFTIRNYKVAFTYSGVANSTTGHVTLNSGGSLVNKDHILSIQSISCNFTTSQAGSLKFKVSYNPTTSWSGETTMVSGETYELGTNPYYFQLTAYGAAVTINSVNITYSCVVNPAAHEGEEPGEDINEYRKVKSSSELESGTYLIVYETSATNAKILNGGLTSSNIDGSANYVTATITTTNNISSIAKSTNVDNAAFTVSSTSNGYSFKSKNNYYIYHTGSKNTLNTSSDVQYNEIEIDSEYIATIISDGYEIKFNTTSGTGDRFRYYSTGANVCLYKLVTVAGSINYDTPVDCVGFTATDSNALTYKTTDIFDTANGLTVVANYNDGTTQTLSKGGVDGYSYVVRDVNGDPIDTSKMFGGKSNGVYTLVVSYKNYIPQEITLNTTFIVAIVSVTNVSTDVATFTTAQKLEGNLNGLTATLTYNDDNFESVTYLNFGGKGLEAVLLDPNGQVHNQSTIFGVAGTWTIRVRVANNISVYGETSITVNAIPVATVSLSQSEASVEEGKTLQLTVTVNPNNATNPNIEWGSNNTSVATVDNNGLVTAVTPGQATITATSVSDNTKYGSCLVTVTEKVTGQDEGTFTLATGSLTVGSYVVITNPTSEGSGYAAGGQNTNNRAAVSVEFSNGTLERDSNSTFKAFLVKAGNTSGTISFYDEEEDGYLYAASSSSNYLRTETNLSDNSSFTVSGSESKTVTAQGSNSRNLLRFNSTSKLFSCYGSGQVNPYIYEKAGDPVYPDSISVSATKTSIGVGETSQLSVTYAPSNTTVKSVTYESSNEFVASVTQDGLVTGLSSGESTITVTGYGDISATIKITVSNISVSSVSLNKSSASMTVGETTTLVPTISPENATNKEVTWSTSDNSVATVDDGVVTGVGAGSATITVKTKDGNKTATCTVTVTSSGGSSGAGQVVTSNSSLSNGDTVVLRTADGDLGVTGWNNTSDATVSATESQWKEFVVGNASASGFTLYDSAAGKYIAMPSANEFKYGNSGGTCSVDSNGKFLIADNQSKDRILGVNGTYYRFYLATSSFAPFYVYSAGSATPTNPTSISITPSSLELSAGKSQSLSVNYQPSGANQNKAVTWSSDNENVATVDTSGKVTVKSTATVGQSTTIRATLTNLTSIKAACTVTVVETAKADHTVLIYICGSNLESDYASDNDGLATGDIEEILKVSGQPSDVNVVIETGGANSWSSKYGISSSKLQRYHVANKKLVLDDSLTYESMGLSSTLQSFVEYGLENYDATRMGLVLWNHGGAMQGVCFDEKKSDDSLLDYEVKNAVSNAYSAKGMSGQKLEWIGYDACLMAVQDIAEMNSSIANYMVASEETEAGYGWDYDNWVDDLYSKKTTPVILKAIVDSFITDNNYNWGPNDNNYGYHPDCNDQTLAYYDLSYAAAYKTAWENMASQMNSSNSIKNNKTAFNTLLMSCKYYGGTSYVYYGLFDAKDFINKISSNNTFNPGSTYTSAVLTAHSNLVAYSSCGQAAGNSYGIALFWAINSKCYKSSYYTSSTTNFTTWRSLVTSYGA